MPTLAQKYPEMWELFNKLWGKAKDNPDYDKSEWTNLDISIVEALVRQEKSSAQLVGLCPHCRGRL